MNTLRSFQRRFIRAAMRPDIDTAALSLPRGNGKSWLCGHIVSRILDPEDKLFRAGTESALCAASIKQARIVFRFARRLLEPKGGYRFQDSANQIQITHKATSTKLVVYGSNGKTAMGLVDCPYVIADEPGSWETVGGELMYDAIETAKGKPGSPLRALYVGTLAPSTSGWWHDMIDDGTHAATYVQALQGNADRWDRWPEIRRCNPLTAVDPRFRRKLLQERDKARDDSRLKARFLSFRLNCPTSDEATTLITVPDWQRVCARPVPEREGRPWIGLDVGRGRAWTAWVALWRNGRIEAGAMTGGLPTLDKREKMDRVPKGAYHQLVEDGVLHVEEGFHEPKIENLAKHLRPLGPRIVVADRTEIDKVKDYMRGFRVVDRRSRWSEATYDIDACRRFAKDGPFAVEPRSARLISVSMQSTIVKNDDMGLSRLVQRDPSNNAGRDDVSAALVLAAGAMARAPKRTGLRIE